MKRLLIIRHAKSSWDQPHLSDFERPLNNRGKRDLPDMATRLADLDLKVDAFISSPANRALTTAIGHAKALGYKEEQVIQKRELYHASASTIRKIVADVEDRHDTVAIFGHNPGLTDVINDLSNFYLDNLPTCAICGIEFEIDKWNEILHRTGRKFLYDFPKSRKF